MPHTLFGMNVLTSPLVKPVPVLQLSNEFTACTDEFRADMNKWLLDMFGTKEVAYVIGGNTLVLNQAVLDSVKQKMIVSGLLNYENGGKQGG